MSPVIPEELLQRKPYLGIYRSFLEAKNDSYKCKKNEKTMEYYIEEKNGHHLSSSLAPGLQADRILANRKIQPKEIIVLFGLGNPTLLTKLDASIEENRILILIDEDPDILPHIWENSLFQVIDRPGRHLFAGISTLDILWNYLDSISIEKVAGVSIFRNQGSIQRNKEFYVQVEDRIQKIVSSKMSDLLTKFEFERIWVRNTILNTIGLGYGRKKFATLEGLLTGIPAVLISAGPTLRGQCNFLKSIRHKAFFVTCDTSLKVLLSNGIVPDAVVTLDAQAHSLFHFLGEDLSKTVVFADLVSAPALFRSIKPLSIYHSLTAKYSVDHTGQPVRDVTAGANFAEKYFENIGAVQSGGSVATTAFDMLRLMDASEIYLAGQDLAYTGYEIHSTGSHHNEKWLTLCSRKKSLEQINMSIILRRSLKKVDGGMDKKVLTDYVLDLYKNWFEESVGTVHFPVYNINSGGALIGNMQNIKISDAEKSFQKKREHEYCWRKKTFWLDSKEVVHFEKIDEMKREIQNCIQSAENLILRLQTLKLDGEIQKIMDVELKENSVFVQLLRKMDIYIKRNQTKLTNEKIKDLYTQNLIREKKILKRFLYRFIELGVNIH